MSDNVISLDKRRQDKAIACAATLTPSPEESAARAAVAAQAAVDQEERSQMHMVLVNATRVLDAKPLSTENRLEIVRGVVRVIMGPGWRVVRK